MKKRASTQENTPELESCLEVEKTMRSQTSASASIIIEGGNSMMMKKEEILKKVPKTTSYSEENVREIARLSKLGATKEEVCLRFNKTEPTIHRWLRKYYEKPGNAEKIWKALGKNTKLVEEKVVSDEITEETTVVKETEPQVVEVISSTETETLDVILDSQLIQRHDGRKIWNDLINKLKAEGKTFAVHSAKRIAELMYMNYSYSIKHFAEMIRDDTDIQILETEMYINRAALAHDAVVITNSEKTEECCKKVSAKVIKVEDYLSESSELNLEDEEWARKLTIPVKLNNNKKIIADFADLKKFCIDTYGFDEITIAVVSLNGKVKESPKSKLRLVVGDQIRITGYDKGYAISAVVEVTKETEKDNCFERRYNKTPLSAVNKKKTAI